MNLQMTGGVVTPPYPPLALSPLDCSLCSPALHADCLCGAVCAKHRGSAS